MNLKIGNKMITLTPGQVKALVGLGTAVYMVLRVFGLIDLGGIPVA